MKALECKKKIHKEAKEGKLLSPYELYNLIMNIISDIEELNSRLQIIEKEAKK